MSRLLLQALCNLTNCFSCTGLLRCANFTREKSEPDLFRDLKYTDHTRGVDQLQLGISRGICYKYPSYYNSSLPSSFHRTLSGIGDGAVSLSLGQTETGLPPKEGKGTKNSCYVISREERMNICAVRNGGRPWYRRTSPSIGTSSSRQDRLVTY